MGHEILQPDGLMPARGFAHVVAATDGRQVSIAGQTAHDGEGVVQGRTLSDQFDAAVANLVTALAAAGGAPEHLVALQIFVTDVAAYRDDLHAIGLAYRRHLGDHYPAISLLGVTELFDPDALVEIVATAVVPDGD